MSKTWLLFALFSFSLLYYLFCTLTLLFSPIVVVCNVFFLLLLSNVSFFFSKSSLFLYRFSSFLTFSFYSYFFFFFLFFLYLCLFSSTSQQRRTPILQNFQIFSFLLVFLLFLSPSHFLQPSLSLSLFLFFSSSVPVCFALFPERFKL